MARLTKIELEQRLDAAVKENEQLRLALAIAEGNVTAYREHGNKLEDELRTLKEGVTQNVSDFRRRCLAARQLAMTSGRSVKV